MQEPLTEFISLIAVIAVTVIQSYIFVTSQIKIQADFKLSMQQNQNCDL